MVDEVLRKFKYINFADRPANNLRHWFVPFML